MFYYYYYYYLHSMLMLYSSSFAHIFMIAIEEEANLCEVRE